MAALTQPVTPGHGHVAPSRAQSRGFRKKDCVSLYEPSSKPHPAGRILPPRSIAKASNHRPMACPQWWPSARTDFSIQGHSKVFKPIQSYSSVFDASFFYFVRYPQTSIWLHAGSGLELLWSLEIGPWSFRHPLSSTFRLALFQIIVPEISAHSSYVGNV